MAKFRRLAALLACVMMASSATACSDTRYSAKIGDDEVKAGVYIAYLSNSLSNQVNTLYYQGITEKPFDQQIDGVSLSQYVKDDAQRSLKEYCAITKQFDAEGLVITDDEMKQINTNLKTSWDSMGELYEYEGVSKESLKELYLVALKKEKLFDHYYDKDGKQAATDEELQQFINENYLRYKIITIYNSSETDEEKKKAENEEKQKQRDELFDKGKDYSFEQFDELIAEYKAATEAASNTDDSSDASNDSSSESSGESSETASSEISSADSKDESSETASSETDSSSDDSQASVDSSDESSKDDSSADESASSEEDSSSQAQNDSSSSGSDDSSETESEPDPYENEVVMNYNNYKDDTDTPSGKLFKFIKELEIGKAAKFDSDYGYYIVIKGDVSQRTDYLEKNRDSVLHAAKEEAFQTLLDGWIASAGITLNDKAMKRYTPEVIYDKMNEYYEKNKSTQS